MNNKTIFVIFGATGDLVKKKLIPALYSLYENKQLEENVIICGTGRSSLSHEEYRERAKSSLETYAKREGDKDKIQEIENKFLSTIFYVSVEIEKEGGFSSLSQFLGSTPYGQEHFDVVYYLAVPPSASKEIASQLEKTGLNNEERGARRLIIEKPFGTNLNTALEYNNFFHAGWKESQIYRIDHYLGKETVQNLLVFRFANEIFESLWNRRYIEYVEITSSESIGTEGRAAYFDTAGIIRDMIQSHLLQVLAMVTLEPPNSFEATPIRNETVKVLENLRPIPQDKMGEHVVLGQYTKSTVRGEKMLGYREEEGVASGTRTETFAALKIFIDNARWSGVPFYLRTGKRLPTRVTEVVIHFKKTPHKAFGCETAGYSNDLVLRIQPDEGVLLNFALKTPGGSFCVSPVNMDFHYKNLGKSISENAYERLLLDAAHGDGTLFARADSVEACWKFIDPIIQYANESTTPLHGYPCGTWGPLQAEDLLLESDHTWRYPCKNLGSGDFCEL